MLKIRIKMNEDFTMIKKRGNAVGAFAHGPFFDSMLDQCMSHIEELHDTSETRSF